MAASRSTPFLDSCRKNKRRMLRCISRGSEATAMAKTSSALGLAQIIPSSGRKALNVAVRTSRTRAGTSSSRAPAKRMPAAHSSVHVR
eukprot:5546491-Amphidinium_carterae.1